MPMTPPIEETAVPVTLEFEPGLFTEDTPRGAKRRWKDGDRVRFHKGRAQKLGGWAAATITGDASRGVPRAAHEWQSLDRENWIAVGTNSKLYVISQGVRYDITPLRRQVTLTNPFATTSGDDDVVVTDANHDAILNDFVRFSGATAVGGLTISGEYQIIQVIDGNTYVIRASGNASATTTGGGTVSAEYDINNGGEDTGYYYGYGTCTWGESTWGTPRGACSTMVAPLRVWSLDNWGEDLIASPSGGAVYYWDRTLGPFTRATLIAQAPLTNQRVLVSPENRQLICLGAQSADGVSDPLLIRVSNNEDFTQFVLELGENDEPLNNVYTRRIDSGSKIITGFRTRNGIIIFTDKTPHMMQPVDSDLVYSVRQLSEGNSIIGPNAGTDVNGIVYWMAKDKFMRYDGVVSEIPCEVWTRVFSSLNAVQADKVYCWHNDVFSEIWWFYPSGGSTENDRYVVFSYAEGHWSYGTMARTAALPKSSAYNYPLAFTPAGVVYQHENGTSDAGVAMNDYLETFDIELGEGREQMHVGRFVPDNFQITGTLNVTFKTKRRPGDPSYTTKGPYAVTSATRELGVRARGRQCAVRFASTAAADNWKLGAYTYYIQPDGER